MDVRVVYSLVSTLFVVMANGDSWAAPERGFYRIVDGKNATRCQFPHQALVQSDEKTVCGGSLITQSIVLTAAGCTVGFKKLTIRLGTNQRTQKDTNTWTAVSTWSKAHPDYDFDGHSENDVALAFLPEKAPLGACIKTVPLPLKADVNKTYVGQRPLISGWGRISNSSEYPEHLRWIQVTVVPNDVCSKIYSAGVIRDSTLCAASNAPGICWGDRGGALVLKTEEGYTQIGVASYFGGDCHSEGTPAGYSRVTSYLNWIAVTGEITLP
ncbi:venom protease-like [Schistocerca americana]|uniref:venom protease-like n=1 Tax=Schistocerca americana TaxID=7009 RepID=UPI001F4F3B88|nr:venom protease-like [Schistocerca americana]